MNPQTPALVIGIFALSACADDSSDEATTGSSSTSGGGGSVPAVFTDNYVNDVTASATDTTVTLNSAGVPDHKSPYWGAEEALHEEQIDGHGLTPGSIREQTFSMTIPLEPTEAATKEPTTLGPIGMAVNGVAIYNDQEGGNIAVDAMTLLTMDVSGAHVGPGGVYHYHFEPAYIASDNDAMIGHLRDGFPVYARRDMDGSYPTDLDSEGGHVGETNEYPDGIYHYHCSSVSYLDGGYYLIKSGNYHGTPGTFTN